MTMARVDWTTPPVVSPEGVRLNTLARFTWTDRVTGRTEVSPWSPRAELEQLPWMLGDRPTRLGVTIENHPGYGLPAGARSAAADTECAA